MVVRFVPQNRNEVSEIIRAAQVKRKSIEIVGRGSKREWGRPCRNSTIMDLSKLSGITLYEPDELVLSASAGTPLKEINEALAAHGQQLAFEPPDLSPLYGGEKDIGTLGGIIATNLSGPRRFQIGAARDHFLGFEAITGRGEEIKSGGRVVKNVTGFDLPKLLAGSFGTLAALISITIKVLPIYDKTRTILIYGLDNKVAIQVLSEILNGPFEVNGAAHLPANIAGKSEVSYLSSSALSVTAVRLQGPKPSVESRCCSIKRQYKTWGEIVELHTQNSNILWDEIRDVVTFLDSHKDQVWRLSVPPSDGATVVSRIRDKMECEVYFDWGGGLIWVVVNEEIKQADILIRDSLLPQGGHATLIRGNEVIRNSSKVFQPQESVVHNITMSIKNEFDPIGILNPGRMYEGI